MSAKSIPFINNSIFYKAFRKNKRNLEMGKKWTHSAGKTYLEGDAI